MERRRKWSKGFPASPTKLRIPGLLAGKGTPPQPPNGTVLGDYFSVCVCVCVCVCVSFLKLRPVSSFRQYTVTRFEGEMASIII